MLFEWAENRRGLIVGSIIGSFYSFINKSFQGPYLNILLISAQPIKGGFQGVWCEVWAEVLDTLINKGYYIDDGVQNDGQTFTNGRPHIVRSQWSKVLLEANCQRYC